VDDPPAPTTRDELDLMDEARFVEEIEAFRSKLEGCAVSSRRRKPNVSSEWLEQLRHRLASTCV